MKVTWNAHVKPQASVTLKVCCTETVLHAADGIVTLYCQLSLLGHYSENERAQPLYRGPNHAWWNDSSTRYASIKKCVVSFSLKIRLITEIIK